MLELCLFHLHTYLPVKMEHTVCSEKLVFKLQTLGNNPEETIRHTLRNFPEERRSKVLLHLASNNHGEDKVLPQFGNRSYSDTNVVQQLASHSDGDSKISQLENQSY
jgi:hypothetical protein